METPVCGGDGWFVIRNFKRTTLHQRACWHWFSNATSPLLHRTPPQKKDCPLEIKPAHAGFFIVAAEAFHRLIPGWAGVNAQPLLTKPAGYPMVPPASRQRHTAWRLRFVHLR